MGLSQGCFGSLAEFKLVSRVCRIGQEGEIRLAYLSHHIDTWVGREWAEVDLQLPHVAAIINVVNGDSTNGTSHIVPGRLAGLVLSPEGVGTDHVPCDVDAVPQRSVQNGRFV